MLAINQLRAGYHGKTIVSMDSFTLPAGEHCLILGKSGSGKTTLLYALCGLLKPSRGSVTLGGAEMTAMKPSALDVFRGRHIGIIYQTLHMIAALPVIKNIVLAQYAAGLAQDEAKAKTLLAQLGLSELSHKKPGALSHGQQQRAAIARAAINSPKLIIGDEPTSALDDEACDKVMQLLLAAAKASGASLIVATHDARIKGYFQHTLHLGESA